MQILINAQGGNSLRIIKRAVPNKHIKGNFPPKKHLFFEFYYTKVTNFLKIVNSNPAKILKAHQCQIGLCMEEKY